MLAVLGGCASLPPDQPRTESHALQGTTGTVLGQAVAPALAAHPGESGFYPLLAGLDAYAARIALARGAQRSLDLQYYIFDADHTGQTLLAELLAAADRGVRVRLLLDDLHLAGHDRELLAIDAHPNVEVRLFNPLAVRGAMRWTEFVTDFSRVNRRMHNKAMTADNQLTVVGGRNIGDAYFDASSESDFSDFDVLGTGPIVAHVSAVFDDYWNSASAYPITALAKPSSPETLAADQQALRAHLLAYTAAEAGTPYAKGLLESGLVQAMRSNTLAGYWGTARVIADRAAKVTLPPEDDATHAIPVLLKWLSSAQRELVLVSPYFVPRDAGVRWLAAQAARGIDVRILTNSFAANDVSAVHAGYAPHRKALLEAGIQLYELKPSAYAELARTDKHVLKGSSRASLHAKTYMVDRHQLFVGSLNLDPRSARLNTEMGVVLESTALCLHLARGIDDKILDVAYKVVLRQDPDTGVTSLQWITRENGLLHTYDSEPGMSAMQAVGQQLLRILPVEENL